MLRVTVILLFLIINSAFGVRSQWERGDRAISSSLIEVRFALFQQNLDILQKTLLDVSDITSPRYGKWWNIENIIELVAPPKEDSELVVSFLKERGTNVNSNSNSISISNHRDMIKLKAPVEFIERLLQTSLYSFSHKTKTSKVIIRAEGGYSIPEEIKKHVDFVSGLFEFPSIKERPHQMTDYKKDVDGYIVPYVINNLYKIPDTFPVNASSSICLVEFQDDQSYDKNDLKTFSKENDIVPEITVSYNIGPFDGSDPDAEATLDVQYGAAIAKNSTVWYWTVAEWMYEFATDFLATKNPPLVVSMSWGWPEPDQCSVGNCTRDETSKQYVDRTNVEFQKIGLLGVTLVAASGDQGAPGDSDPDCSGRGKKALSGIFPGASPWVLSVGATQLTNSTEENSLSEALPPICNKFSCATSTTELVCSFPAALITTGGGFSAYSSVPSYQSSVASSYLSSGIALPPSTDFNATNRGFPDVSALGHNYLIRLSDQFEPVDGTSCSSPVFAAIIALLNSYRLNHGKPSLGFVAPLLYQAYASDPTIFTDITTGDNKCTEQCCSKIGFEATKGWDPVTGLGTPNFDKLLTFIQTLP